MIDNPYTVVKRGPFYYIELYNKEVTSATTKNQAEYLAKILWDAYKQGESHAIN